MNRARLAERFVNSASGRSHWKTFVIEAHADGSPADLLVEAFGRTQVAETDDVHLHEVHTGPPLVVDHLDSRFWSVHTTAPAAEARAFLKDTIEARRDLDWMWLPSEHLRNLWPNTTPRWVSTDFSNGRLTPAADEVSDLRLRVHGRSADAVLRLIESEYGRAVSFSGVAVRAVDDDLGIVDEAVSREGRFVARGDDFGFHQALVQRVIRNYRQFVEAVEARALRWTPLPGGGATLTGAPVVIKFSSPIPDLPWFLDHLFSSREPFRLWGIPEMVGPDRAEVEAVDLHVGQTLRFDITSEWLRVYLFEGGCGNTVARLASNLQHHLDGALSIVDAALDASLKRSA